MNLLSSLFQHSSIDQGVVHNLELDTQRVHILIDFASILINTIDRMYEWIFHHYLEHLHFVMLDVNDRRVTRIGKKEERGLKNRKWSKCILQVNEMAGKDHLSFFIDSNTTLSTVHWNLFSDGVVSNLKGSYIYLFNYVDKNRAWALEGSIWASTDKGECIKLQIRKIKINHSHRLLSAVEYNTHSIEQNGRNTYKRCQTNTRWDICF